MAGRPTGLCQHLHVDALSELGKLTATFLGTRKAFDLTADALPSPQLLVPALSAAVVELP